jgi:GT2 family glycosyltransferase
MSALRERLAVVVLTHNRAPELRRTLTHMLALPERPGIVVVDNASSDSTSSMVEREFPNVTLLVQQRNIGAAARNIGALQTRTPYVAFCDDDTWWTQGALEKAADLLDAYPKVAVLSARVLVGAEGREDPTCALMADSPFPPDGLPGPGLLGFLAGACVMRRQAFIEAGGYEANFFIGGEEALLALDLVVSGWRLVYAAQLTVHHHQSAARDSIQRERLLIRNALWVAWMRLPPLGMLRDTLRICSQPYPRKVLALSFLSALRGLPWVFKKRKVIPGNIALLYRMVHR